jgi:transcriptional regulator with XRE-family HTH domain
VKAAQQFGANVRKLRQAKALSQEQLALDAGLDLSYISNIEGGKRNVSLGSILKLANALGVKPAKLLMGVDLDEDSD